MHCPICLSKKTCFFAQKNTYTFYRCTICKTIFLSSLPSQKKLNIYYSKQFSYKDGLNNQEIIQKRSRVILKKISKLMPQAKTLCDVGSGLGIFLDNAKHSGFEVTGIEPSKQLAQFSKQSFHISPFIGELKTYINTNHNKFDIVTCIHVIEHVSDPKQFIAFLLRLVKPGGLLYVETPNSDSHLLYAEKENYTFLIPPEHLWLFSMKSIKILLSKNTRLTDINTYSYSEHVMGIIKALLFKKKVKNNKTSIFRNIEVRSENKLKTIKKKLFYYLFDRTIAPIFTGMLNLNHKGSILELYIKKDIDKSGL